MNEQLTPQQIRQLAEEMKRVEAVSAQTVDNQQSIRDALIDQTKELKFQQTLKQDILKSVNQIYRLQYDLRTEYDKELGTQQAQLSIERDIEKTLKSKIGILQDIKILELDNSQLSKDIRENLKAQVKEADDLLKTLNQQKETSSQIRNNFGTIGFQALSEIFTKIGGKASILSTPFEAMAKASREAVQSGIENNKKIEERQGILEKIKSGELKATKENLKGIEIIGEKGSKLYGPAAEKALKSGSASVKNIGEVMSKSQLGISGLQAGFGALGPVISKVFAPLAIITTIVDVVKFFVNAMFDADKQVTDLAKSLNISKDAARDVRDRFYDIAESAPLLTNILEGNLINQKDLVATQIKFNQLLGTAVDLSKFQNEEFVAQLTNANKFLKLNDEEFKGLTNLYYQTGKTVENIKNSILGTAKAYKLQTGLQIDERKILGDVLKTSNAIKLSIKGGTEALVEATINANKFGTTLDQLDKTADSLLNFEQSISSELEAELLLGRDLNLERARAAALTNDQVALTEEVGNLVKGFGPDFEKNTLAQDAFAKTLGISRKELADMYTTYQQNEKLADVQRKAAIKLTKDEIKLLESKGEAGKKVVADMQAGTLTGVEFYDALKMAGFEGQRLTDVLAGLSEKSLASQSAEEKFNDALEKAKETFTRFVDGESLDKFADLLTKFVESVQIKGFWSTLFFGTASDVEIAESGKKRLQEKLEKTTDPEEKKALEAKIKEAGIKIKELKEEEQKQKEEEQLKMNASAYNMTPEEYKAFLKRIEEKNRKEIEEENKNIDKLLNKTPSTTTTTIKPRDFIIKPLEEDTIIAAGGTNLGRTDEMVTLLKDLLQATKTGKDIYIDSSKVTGALELTNYKSGFRGR